MTITSQLNRTLREAARTTAESVISSLELPEGTALAATGSLARGELSPHSDLDLILLYHAQTPDVDALFAEVEHLWYPIWDAKIRLDYAVRTPEECYALVSENSITALGLLELTHLRGEASLTATTRSGVLKAWRRQLQKNFDAVVELAIARWRRAGSVVSMTKPDIKNGRGGLRDEELIHALALGNLCDAPDLSAQRTLLLNVRTMLHHHAGRPRDVLDPEFAVDVAQDLGFADRYELARAIAEASRSIDDGLTRALSIARDTVPRRNPSRHYRRPLDIDVVDNNGEITLSRHPDLSDPALVLRVAAARARTGLPIASSTWTRLKQLPPMPHHWPTPAITDFFALLSSPDHTASVITELDQHGLWTPLVPAWEHIRGRMPREQTHTKTIDRHNLAVVENCAARNVAVERPDLLYLAALFHDSGKGYPHPHEEIGAELVAHMAATLRLNHQDTAVVTTLVRHHTLIPRLVAHHDIESADVLTKLLDAVGYNLLTINLLEVLVHADALGTGPGVWSPSLRTGTTYLCRRARAHLTAIPPTPPQPPTPMPTTELTLYPQQESTASVVWTGRCIRDSIDVLALIAAKEWTITTADIVGDNEHVVARFGVYNTLGTEFSHDEFLQAYKSGVHSFLPELAPGATATFWFGDVLEVRTTDRPGALGTLIGVLPQLHWLTMTTPGATMIVQCSLRPGYDRIRVERDVTQALANG